MQATTYLSGLVRRYHANPDFAHFGQTNSQHQWGCALLIYSLHPKPTLSLIASALFHDVGEIFTGDWPFEFKMLHPEIAALGAKIEAEAAADMGLKMPELSDEDKRWLKFVDRLEPILFAQHHAPHMLTREDWPDQIQAVKSVAISLGANIEGVIQ